MTWDKFYKTTAIADPVENTGHRYFHETFPKFLEHLRADALSIKSFCETGKDTAIIVDLHLHGLVRYNISLHLEFQILRFWLS